VIALSLLCLTGLGLAFLNDNELGIAICAFAVGTTFMYLVSRIERRAGTGRKR
jgi:ABC-type Mn2+/Zn2+ transport system permease subunit